MMSEENEDDDENQDELNNNNIYIREVSLLNSLQQTSNTSLREDFLWLRQWYYYLLVIKYHQTLWW